jgi:hypothetical protein
MEQDIPFIEYDLVESKDEEKITEKDLEIIISTENNSQLRQYQENEIGNEPEETNSAAVRQVSIKKTEYMIFSGK